MHGSEGTSGPRIERIASEPRLTLAVFRLPIFRESSVSVIVAFA